MAPVKIQVVKVGGSLLDLADLPQRLRQWLTGYPHTHSVVIVGGGPAVGQLREADRLRPLGQAEAHWLAIETMTANSRAVAAALPEVKWVAQWDELKLRLHDPGGTIFDPSLFLRQIEPLAAGQRLPWTWDVTSDSIAGRLAIVLQAAELILLKSRLPGDPCTLSSLSQTGYVDRFFPELLPELPAVRVFDFRANEPCSCLIGGAYRTWSDRGPHGQHQTPVD